eukprot:4789408-Pyramimonas_sp.AAC.1
MVPETFDTLYVRFARWLEAKRFSLILLLPQLVAERGWPWAGRVVQSVAEDSAAEALLDACGQFRLPGRTVRGSTAT